MNYIFGAGLVGLLAKHILPGDWTIIPFGKSRFFSYSPPIDNDYIIYEPRIDDVMAKIVPHKQILMRKRAWSLGGQLFPGYNKDCANDWLQKIFGPEPPGQSHAYLSHHMSFASYNINLSNLYDCLMQRYAKDCEAGRLYGKVTEVGNHYFIAGGKKHDFVDAVSTIPLYAMLDLAKLPHTLKTRDCQAVQLCSSKIDLEGHDQIYVADSHIEFYKVSKLDDGSYVFYFHGTDVTQPAQYLMHVLDEFKILNGTVIEKYIPLGRADLNVLKAMGFTPIGAYAEWDWYCDISTNIIRLLHLDKYKSQSIVY